MESDPNGKTANEPGSKLDAGKVCGFTGLVGYFPRALRSVAEVSDFGARKYTRGGWRTVPNGIDRYTDAMVRHLLNEGEGNVLDADSGLAEAAHTAWNALARLELMIDADQAMLEFFESQEGQDLFDYIKQDYYLNPPCLLPADALSFEPKDTE